MTISENVVQVWVARVHDTSCACVCVYMCVILAENVVQVWVAHIHTHTRTYTHTHTHTKYHGHEDTRNHTLSLSRSLSLSLSHTHTHTHTQTHTHTHTNTRTLAQSPLKLLCNSWYYAHKSLFVLPVFLCVLSATLRILHVCVLCSIIFFSFSQKRVVHTHTVF